MAFWSWSKTAASNATADSSINWAEGQAPSSVNDSARAMMARTAEYRDDICGAIVTGGTSTAYTVSSNQVFDSLAHMANALIAFTPHATNGATVTLNVDGLGAKPLRPSPNVELQSNVLIVGTPYMVTYNNSDAVWYLYGNVGTAAFIPLGAGMDFWGSTAPSSAFAFPAGQAISRTTYASLFALISTTYGSGDSSTTFNLPDKTGRVSAMKEASAARLTATYFGFSSGQSGATLGGVGGGESQLLGTTQIPSHSHANTLNDPQHSHTITGGTVGGSTTANLGTGGTSAPITPFAIAVASASTGMTITNASTGGGLPHANVQPTIVCNYIMRVL